MVNRFNYFFCWRVLCDIRLTWLGSYTSRQCVCIVFHFLVVYFVYSTFCIYLVLITWLWTLKDPVSMILFYFMSLWYISIMNYNIRWTTNVKIIQSRSGINYLWILMNSIYNFWTSLNLGLFLNLFLHTFDFFNSVC